MAIEFVVTASAQFEIDAAVVWYDSINHEISDRLLSEIDIAFDKILQHPQAWPVFANKYRHYSLQKFPYSIMYTFSGQRIEILAFAHHRRKPLYWAEESVT